jgi:hypothetical protein
MTAKRTEQDSVAVEPHCPPPWPVSALEQEPLAVPWRRFPDRTPHGGHDLESLPDGIGRVRRVEGPGRPPAFSASHRWIAASIACIRCQKPTVWSADQVHTCSPGAVVRKRSSRSAAPAWNQSSKPAGTGDRCGTPAGGSQPLHSSASPSHDRSPRPGGCCIRSPITRATYLCTTPRCKIRSVTTHPGHDGTPGAASKPTAVRPAASKAATSRRKCPT